MLIPRTREPVIKKPTVNISIQIQALVLRQRTSENSVGILNGLWFTRQSSFSLTMGNNGIMTCSSCIIRLKKTLDHCLQDRLWIGKVHTSLNLNLLSQPQSSNSKTIVIKQQRLPARQVINVPDFWHMSPNWWKAKTKIKTKRKVTKTFQDTVKVNTRNMGNVLRSGLGPVNTQRKNQAGYTVCTNKWRGRTI